MEKRIPILYMEQQFLGELSAKKEKQIKDHPDFSKSRDEIELSNREILTKYPSRKMASLLLARMEEEANVHDFSESSDNRSGTEILPEKKSKFSKILSSLPKATLAAAALAAAVVLPLIITDNNEQVQSEEPTVRIKGLTPHLNIYRKYGEDVQLLPSETKVDNYDLLQLSYVSGGKKYGAIFSIDGNGFITLHYPDFTGDSPELTRGGEVPLDFSYQLDDAPGFERFFFVTSDSFFSVNGILESASKIATSFYSARNGELEIPPVCEIDSILLIKEGLDE